MGFFKDRKKGLCPECGSEIEDINDKFCGNCGWKISKFKAIKARNNKKTELKKKKHEANAEKNKQEFKQSLQEIKNSRKDVKQIKEEHKSEAKQKIDTSKNQMNRDLKKEVNEPSREEVEKKAEEIRKKINGMNNLGFKKPNEKKYSPFMKDGKVYFKSFQANLDIGKDLNDALDEGLIRKYGSQDEIAQIEEKKRIKRMEIEKRHKFDDKVEEARNCVYGVEREKGIKLFEEIIEDSDIYTFAVADAYMELPDQYIFFDDYDKAIALVEEQIAILKHFEEDSKGAESMLNHYKERKSKNNLLKFEREGSSKYYATEFDEALYPLEKCVELGTTDNQTFEFLANIYIRYKDLESAINVLNMGIERIEKRGAEWNKSHLHTDRNEGLKDILENVNHKIETGKFKWDCLPVDKNEIAPKIKEAKANLNKDNKEKGVELLEEIMENGTFNNTVYNTLYQTYKKDKKYDDCIRVCEKAIDVLGFFSNDRYEKWSKNLNNSVELKEKGNDLLWIK